MRTDAPKIFISYSWKPQVNKNKVKELTDRLFSDGVHVIIDIYDLAEGQDKYTFMEKMVNDDSISKVLLICNKEYQKKADSKIGGVGEESLIVSKKIYESINNTKFIPVIFEYDESNKPYLPTFIHSRIFIDLSSNDNFEEEYDKLLRNIFGKPLHVRPPLGNAPSFITEDKPILLKTTYQVRNLKTALLNNNPNINFLIKNYLNIFIDSLKDFQIDALDKTKPIDDLIVDKIDEMKVLRNDYLDYLNLIIDYSDNLNINIIHSFFENLLSFTYSLENENTTRYDYSFNEHYRFFVYEIFLYTVSIFVKNKKFGFLKNILYNFYDVNCEREYMSGYRDFVVFRPYLAALNEERNRRLNLNRINITADKIYERADYIGIKFGDLRQTDILLYYMSFFVKSNNRFNPGYWYPMLTIYFGKDFYLFKKLENENYFEMIKIIFTVDSKKDLVIKLKEIQESNEFKTRRMDYGYGNGIEGITEDFNIKNLINLQN